MSAAESLLRRVVDYYAGLFPPAAGHGDCSQQLRISARRSRLPDAGSFVVSAARLEEFVAVFEQVCWGGPKVPGL